jgi:hypothetical protein
MLSLKMIFRVPSFSQMGSRGPAQHSGLLPMEKVKVCGGPRDESGGVQVRAEQHGPYQATPVAVHAPGDRQWSSGGPVTLVPREQHRGCSLSP